MIYNSDYKVAGVQREETLVGLGVNYLSAAHKNKSKLENNYGFYSKYVSFFLLNHSFFNPNHSFFGKYHSFFKINHSFFGMFYRYFQGFYCLNLLNSGLNSHSIFIKININNLNN
jgi:hypothetical protein